MAIKVGNTMENFKNEQEKYYNLVNNENATPEQLEAASKNMFEALKNDLTTKITAEARASMSDSNVLASRGINVLTSEEREFFNAAVIDGGFNDAKILPSTTQQRVFEGLVKAHPLLEAIGLQDLGAVTKFVYSDPTRTYMWKELFTDIQGQVNAAFREETITQLKLTAFAVIPNDMIDLGPEYIELYVRTLLIESIATGLEFGYINGRGPTMSEPVGLLKDVDAVSGAVTDKVSSGTLTFAPSQYGETVTGELYNVVKLLSTNAKNEARNVSNLVVMIINPIDAIGVQFRNTIQTSDGQFVTALPYNISVVESEQVPVGKAIFMLKGEYIAAIAGAYQLKRFDQTLAIEDAVLYTIKRYANGRPKDNKAALVFDLDIQFPVTP